MRSVAPLKTAISIRHISCQSGCLKQRTLEHLLPNGMPKKRGSSTAQREKLRHVKYREQIGGKLRVPGIIDLQVIGSGGRGTSKTCIMSTNHTRYLFNCGEGTQRLATEHKIKLSRLENIFITHNSWDNVGGLLGMALTLEDVNVPKLIVHGPAHVEKTIKMAKGFAEIDNIQIQKKEIEEGAFEDYGFRIEYVRLDKKSDVGSLMNGSSVSKTSVDRENADGNCTEEPPAKRQKTQESEEFVVAYICKPHAAQRNLIIENCVDLGIPRGPLLGKLKDLECVTLEDGRVIHPDQVLSPEEKPCSVLVLECPSKDYLDSLSSSKMLKSLQDESGTGTRVTELIVHMSPSEVMADSRYQEWLKKFHSQTAHLVLNDRASDVASIGIYKIQAMLNLLSPTIFPLLPQQQHRQPCEMDENAKEILASTNLKFQLRPKKGFNSQQCLTIDNSSYISEAHQQNSFEERLQAFHKCTSSYSMLPEHQCKFPELVFLGTGSSVPSKVRNVSAILLHSDPDTTILLDCGEGTAGQIYRHYGTKTDEVLQKLSAVFISHMHADHHLGLFGVLIERQKALKLAGKPLTPILLLAPIQISRWLKFYNSYMESVDHLICLIPLQNLLPHQLEQAGTVHSHHILSMLKLSQFLPVEVDHCSNAFGVAISHSHNWKIVYSGDTMPCERLVCAGKDCDLLIHEATMEDDLEEEAKFKRHSTTAQAIDVGVRMRAKFILLNHFSQRYAKIPVISDKFSERVGIAFDNMRIHFSDLPLLPHMKEPLKALFAEEYAEMEKKIQKRVLRKQLIEREIRSASPVKV